MKKGSAYGYELLGEINQHALTDATIERGALYRTLRTLEENGNVISDWDVSGPGPARRQYKLTRDGEIHLEEWAEVMGNMAAAMSQFVDGVNKLRRTGK
jgi:DNA-binding PadR family transcriptional regulator